MFLLVLYQNDFEQKFGLFETIEQGRKFLNLIPGYSIKSKGGFEYETINSSALKDYEEIKFNNHIIPFTRFSFHNNELINIDWYELPNFSKEGFGIISGATKVDAYVINNENVKNYIKKREEKYIHVKNLLKEKGFNVDRSFAGSEDGEAILYKQNNSDKWHFLCHMDPDFVERNISDKEFLEYIIEE